MAPNVPPRIWKAGPDEEHRLAFPSHHEALEQATDGANTPRPS
jgi:hypothetical protein